MRTYELKKGSKLAVGDDGASAASNADLEAGIVANPDDVSQFLVYGDWLEAKGDPRGELVSVQAALLKKASDKKLKAREKELLERHKRHFLGDVMEIENAAEALRFTWHLGFLQSVMIGAKEDSGDDIDAEGAVRGILTLPSAKFLRELKVGLFDTEDGQPDYGKFLKAMAKAGLPRTLRKLDFDIGDFQISWATLGNVSPLYPQLANLEELRIETGKVELGNIKLPNLQRFEIVTGGFTRGNMKSVSSASWPKLHTLTLYFGSKHYGGNCTIADLQTVLSGKGLGKLKHLTLCNAEFEDDIAKAVVSAKIVRQLETLDLSRGTMTDAGAEALIAGAAKLSHLKSLDVSHNFISPAACKKLRKALKNAEVGGQERPDAEYRYVQVAE